MDIDSVTNASERDHVHSLSEALASFGKIARNAIGKSNENGDAISADIFTEISHGVDKWLWIVEAHLQLQRRRHETSRAKLMRFTVRLWFSLLRTNDER